jgi:hypothetical protein
MADRPHINSWVDNSEPDYYTMFIKGWIPFNAWYFSEYNTKTDRIALEHIKSTRNKIRNRIEALLSNEDYDSKTFRYHLGQLHLQLESRRIMNYEEVISFKTIKLDNVPEDTITDTDKNRNIYKAIPNKATGYKIIVTNETGTRTFIDRTYNPYNIDNLKIDSQFILTSKAMQKKILECFEKINPKRPFNLVSTSKVKADYIVLDNESRTYFIKDTELIAKSLVGVLYTLRCLLFHGELDPTKINLKIYEHAYFLLKPIIIELR